MNSASGRMNKALELSPDAADGQPAGLSVAGLIGGKAARASCTRVAHLLGHILEKVARKRGR